MKSRAGRIILKILAVLVTLILVVPLIIPLPLIDDTPAGALADPDSQFITINGLQVHLKAKGEGEPVFVLLHGFGASLYSWNPVMEAFSQLGTVIAYDRPAFGLTERPMEWEGPNPYSPEAQVELVVALLDHFGIQKAVLVGNSAGGTVAMQTYLARPERIQALILVDPAVYTGGGSPTWIRPLLATPQLRRIGPLIVRRLLLSRGTQLIETAWHNPDLITQETLALYTKPLKVENWDRALWEFTLASRPSGLVDRLNEFTLLVLVITGDDDRIVPTADSIRLANELPNAELVVIPAAGHVPHEEKPEEFMTSVISFINYLIP